MAHTGIIPVRGTEAKRRENRPASAASRRFPFASVAAFFLFAAVALAGWPVESLELRLAPAVPAAADGTIIFSAAAPLGRAFQTRYLHSVQLSPVEDEYRIQEGRIWSWREKVMSHNAGLPTHPLPRGRYVSEPPWMIMEGGGASWPEIFVRIGDARFGNNEIYGSGIPPIALWRLFPGQRVRLGVTACPLLSLLIHQAP